MDDLVTDLRVIATERGRLDAADRARIVEMVDRFEWMQGELTATRQALFETNAQRLAASERLAELQPKPSLPFSMSSGWMTFQPRVP